MRVVVSITANAAVGKRYVNHSTGDRQPRKMLTGVDARPCRDHDHVTMRRRWIDPMLKEWSL